MYMSSGYIVFFASGVLYEQRSNCSGGAWCIGIYTPISGLSIIPRASLSNWGLEILLNINWRHQMVVITAAITGVFGFTFFHPLFRLIFSAAQLAKHGLLDRVTIK